MTPFFHFARELYGGTFCQYSVLLQPKTSEITENRKFLQVSSNRVSHWGYHWPLPSSRRSLVRSRRQYFVHQRRVSVKMDHFFHVC